MIKKVAKKIGRIGLVVGTGLTALILQGCVGVGQFAADVVDPLGITREFTQEFVGGGNRPNQLITYVGNRWVSDFNNNSFYDWNEVQRTDCPRREDTIYIGAENSDMRTRFYDWEVSITDSGGKEVSRSRRNGDEYCMGVRFSPFSFSPGTYTASFSVMGQRDRADIGSVTFRVIGDFISEKTTVDGYPENKFESIEAVKKRMETEMFTKKGI